MVAGARRASQKPKPTRTVMMKARLNDMMAAHEANRLVEVGADRWVGRPRASGHWNHDLLSGHLVVDVGVGEVAAP